MTTICRHIKTNGERCGSPSLRDHAFCYFHRSLSQRHPKPSAPDPIPTIIHPMDPLRELQVAAVNASNLDLPPLEDRESIQLAASMVVSALARNTLDTSRAGTLLYGLQVASANVGRVNHRPSRSYLVTETTLSSTGEEIAPDEDPEGELDFQQFLHEVLKDEEEEEDTEHEYNQLAPLQL